MLSLKRMRQRAVSSFQIADIPAWTGHFENPVPVAFKVRALLRTEATKIVPIKEMMSKLYLSSSTSRDAYLNITN